MQNPQGSTSRAPSISNALQYSHEPLSRNSPFWSAVGERRVDEWKWGVGTGGMRSAGDPVYPAGADGSGCRSSAISLTSKM